MSNESINWIGSAWKWIAGTPDATDWDEVVKSQNSIIENNNEQYQINQKIMETNQQILDEYNKIVHYIEEDNKGEYLQAVYNGLTIIKEEIKEVTRAIQWAKIGIINTNLLDKSEINNLVTEIETLPYSNDIEAIEYAKPLVMIKNSTILYVISIPKTRSQTYNHVTIRSTISNDKRIYLEYKELLTSQREIFGIKEKCKLFQEALICETNQVQKLKENHCINQLLKGIHASYKYEFSNEEEIEPLNDDTIFLNNFSGELI